MEGGEEGPAVLGRHQVVDDGVDGGAEVVEHAGEQVQLLVHRHVDILVPQEQPAGGDEGGGEWRMNEKEEEEKDEEKDEMRFN